MLIRSILCQSNQENMAGARLVFSLAQPVLEVFHFFSADDNLLLRIVLQFDLETTIRIGNNVSDRIDINNEFTADPEELYRIKQLFKLLKRLIEQIVFFVIGIQISRLVFAVEALDRIRFNNP